MGISIMGGGGGATIQLNNLKDVDINLPRLNVPRLRIQNNGDGVDPAISFNSENDTGISLTATGTLSTIIEGQECMKVVGFSPTSINVLSISPGEPTSGPYITASGPDADVDVNISAQNSGTINLLGNTLITDELGPLGEPIKVGVVNNPAALFEVRSISKGFLFPRVTTNQRDTISNPVDGLEVYNKNTGQKEFFKGSVWRSTTNSEVKEISTAHTALESEDIIVSSGNTTVTLPPVSTSKRILNIKSTNGVVTLSPDGSDTIDGRSTRRVTPDQCLTLAPTTAGWIII